MHDLDNGTLVLLQKGDWSRTCQSLGLLYPNESYENINGSNGGSFQEEYAYNYNGKDSWH